MTWLPVTVTVEPTSEPLTLDEAKAQCRVDDTASDSLLTSYILAARHMAEQTCGIKIMPQTVQAKCSSWWDLESLPTAPITAITSVEYLDIEGNLQTLSTDIYTPVLDGLRPTIRLNVNRWWPPLLGLIGPLNYFPDAVRIVATAGYSTVPETIRAAMLMMIAQWYDERTSISSVRQTATSDGSLPTLPNTVNALLDNYRRF